MDLILIRDSFNSWGVISHITPTNNYDKVAVTLEHAYEQPDGSFLPKIPVGSYTCVRGMHQLEGMAQPFETFEITQVPGHTNILFHVGNYNKDSEGCVLLGSELGNQMILNSTMAFKDFMFLQNGTHQFQLTVK